MDCPCACIGNSFCYIKDGELRPDRCEVNNRLYTLELTSRNMKYGPFESKVSIFDGKSKMVSDVFPDGTDYHC